MAIKTFAAIDVGSFELNMTIFEVDKKNGIRTIENLNQRLDLGSDTYSNGKISNAKMDELCKTLKEFANVMKAYKVDGYKAYGTSAIRETENTMIVLDQIEQRTGIRVETLSNSEQRFLDYKSVAAKGDYFRKILEERTAIVDIGGGSIQVSLFDNDTLVSTQNVKLGVLRLQEQLSHLGAGKAQTVRLVEEMVNAQLSIYKKLYLKDRTIHNIIIVDDYISPWAVKRNLKDGKPAILGVGDFDELIKLLMGHSTMEDAIKLDIPEEKVPLVLISAVLAKKITTILGAEHIWAPGVTLCDGIAYEYAESLKLMKGEHDFEEDIIACASSICKRYLGSRKRAEALENQALVIFDGMKKLHGLKARERLYLRLAATLSECGKYISLVNVGENSYNIVMATEIIGLSHAERSMVANIVRFNHSEFIYYGQPDSKMSELTKEQYLIVAKLTAILRLANSLDKSHKQKLKTLTASLHENELVLLADSTEDLVLETGHFATNVDFFQEVFSVKPVLKQKKRN